MNLADRPHLPPGVVSTPGMGSHGVASRRLGRPGLKLSDIEGMASAKAAGLAQGRPSALPLPRKPPPAGENGTPFANFSKIVCVPSSQGPPYIHSHSLEIHQVPCASQTRLYYMQKASTLVAVLPSVSTCPNSISKTNSARVFTAPSARSCTNLHAYSWP